MILDKLLFTLASHAEQVEHAADTTAAAAAHAEHGGGAPELPNILHMLYLAFKTELFHSWYLWENVIFGFFILLLFCFISTRIYRKRQLIPGKLQNVAEIAVEGLNNFFSTILGHNAQRYTPFLGTLFIYILCMNLMGLVPFFKSPTSSMNITLSLALIVFIYVQGAGMRRLGFFTYIHHLMGSPRDVIGWVLVPINLPIHIIGELAKPVSLSLRLFGNITGEDVLIAAFVGLGVLLLGPLHDLIGMHDRIIGVPLQFPFYFLALLTSTIQALVFTLLSTVYFAMMMPHEEEEEH